MFSGSKQLLTDFLTMGRSNWHNRLAWIGSFWDSGRVVIHHNTSKNTQPWRVGLARYSAAMFIKDLDPYDIRSSLGNHFPLMFIRPDFSFLFFFNNPVTITILVLGFLKACIKIYNDGANKAITLFTIALRGCLYCPQKVLWCTLHLNSMNHP